MTDTNGSSATATKTAALILSNDKFHMVPHVKEEFVVDLTNVSFETVLFRMLTTNPQRYLVTPTKGVIKPNASIRVTVMLNHSRPEEEKNVGSFDDFRVQYCVMGPNDIIEPNCANVPDLIKTRNMVDKKQVGLKKFRCMFKESPRPMNNPTGAEHADTSPRASVPTEGAAISPKRAETLSPSVPAAKTNPRELEVNTLAEKNRRELTQKQKSPKKTALLALLMAVAAVLLGTWVMST